MGRPGPNERARRLYAKAVRDDRRVASAADSIEQGGFSNVWIEPAVQAIERLLRLGYGEAEDDETGGA